MSYPPDLIHFCHDILREGCKRFDMSMGIVSHIVHDIYEVIAIYPESEDIFPGSTFDLQDTYCREVVLTDSIVAITSYDGQPGLQNHPLYKAMSIEAYLSAPIHYDEVIWGTINFSNIEVHSTPFSAADQLWMDVRAINLSHKLRSFEI